MPPGLSFSFPGKSYLDVQRDGLAHHAWRTAQKSGWRDRTPLPRVLVNYLRHRETTYESLLRADRRKPNRAILRLEYRHHIFNAIAREYPELAPECERQRLRS